MSSIETETQLPLPTTWTLPIDGTLTHIDVGSLQLESGAMLPAVTVAAQCWGTPSPALDNIVLVEHALTGDSHVTGPTDADHDSPGWWDGMVGPGAPIDTNEWCVLATNVLGGCNGTTGPSSPAPDGRPWGSRFPAISIRDQITAEAAVADALGIERLAAVIGGSMGGMRALEWIVGHPTRVASALILAVNACATAEQIANQTNQVAIVTADPDWQGGDYYGTGRRPDVGLGLARRIAHLSYRTASEMESRFGNRPQQNENTWTGGRYAVQSYLDHQAGKLTARFDAGTYVVLTESINRHDVGQGRGGVAAALAATPVPAIVGAVDSDRYFPLYQLEELAAGLAGCDGLRVVRSDAGHDGFLTESAWVTELLDETLELARRSRQLTV